MLDAHLLEEEKHLRSFPARSDELTKRMKHCFPLPSLIVEVIDEYRYTVPLKIPNAHRGPTCGDAAYRACHRSFLTFRFRKIS